MPAHHHWAVRLAVRQFIFLDLAKPITAQSQPPETNRQTPSRGNFHIAAADQYPTP